MQITPTEGGLAQTIKAGGLQRCLFLNTGVSMCIVPGWEVRQRLPMFLQGIGRPMPDIWR